tara:strand:- start:1981 stop:3051 length:1071 start_codon:yes stop_codon:yes gene_type:complete
MAIHGTGSPLLMSEIQTEFGGSNPISMSEYYAGGANVPSGTSGNGGDIPSSGAINFNIFYTAAKSTRVAIALQISQAATSSYNIFSNKGGSYSAGQSDVTLTVQANVTSGATGQAAIETGSFASGDTVKIINNAQIIAKGGTGGGGAQATGQNTTQIAGSVGGAAGHAINLQFPVTIQNNGGHIRGGGGGGGGGGNASQVTSKGAVQTSLGGGGGGGGNASQVTSKGSVQTSLGGGGGGGGAAVGAGGAAGATSGSPNIRVAAAGQAGGATSAGNGGQGAASGATGEPANGGVGGNAGTFASAGQAGSSGSSRNNSGLIFTGGAGGAGGAAGKAINLNSNQLTWEDGNTNIQGAVS